MLLQVILVDAATGIVKAIRVVSMSPEFTTLLHAAIREQAAVPFDEEAYDAAVDRVYASGRADDLVRRALIVETAGKV